MADDLEIEATPLQYFSPLDEEAFFYWLRQIPGVLDYRGQGHILFVRVDATAIDEPSLRELLGLFHRYRMNMKALAVFDRPQVAHWFRDKRAYWHAAVFGNS